jgi:hypothetical protein
MTDKYVNQLAPAALPIIDSDYILVSRDGIVLNQTPATSIKDHVRSVYYSLAAVTNNSNTTLANLTELQFPVVAGKNYFFNYTIRYQTAATTTGIVFTAAAPAGILSGMFHAVVAADGTAGGFQGSITTPGYLVSTTTVAAANTDTVAIFTGIYNCTTTGTFTPQFRSSANGSNVVVGIGSAGLVISS